VTVEIKEGTARFGKDQVTIIDLPGTYSLCTCSMEEQVARNFIVDEKPDVVVDVIDATNLERHLYLTVQLLELGVRPVLALNMWDEVKSKGLDISTELLSKLLGLTIVPTNARTGEGVQELLAAAVKQGSDKINISADFAVRLPDELETAVIQLKTEVEALGEIKYNRRWLALQLFEQDRQIESMVRGLPQGNQVLALRDRLLQSLSKMLGDLPESYIAESRYGFIAGAVKETVKQTRPNRVEISDQIDSVVTHRFWAYPIFILFMWALFQATFKLGEYPMGWIESLFDWLQGVVSSSLPQGVLRDLISDGIIAGVGGVIVFLPNILILFLGISIMEDTGYMARAAFITDKLMHRIGLHGKSFIPMIMGLGCSVPAIMAARTLESRKDRIKTILLTPLVSCSARLPVFVLFAGALFPHHAANVVFLFQVVFGFGAFILMGFVFKHTLFKKRGGLSLCDGTAPL
jgi:ferrous iron transport protein B